ncbi:MAG: hypothetical protein U1F76_15845 [Candidatus Competibacteraceae bacterium]
MNPHEPHPLSSNRLLSQKSKLVSTEDAVCLIQEGNAVATGGCFGIGFPEGITIAPKPSTYRPSSATVGSR